MNTLSIRSDSSEEQKICGTNFPSIEKNVYFTKAYAKLFEEKENGMAEQFIYSSQYGKVNHTFIKRLIPVESGGECFYDITTPYGYGGPIITDVSDMELLLKNYFEAFHDYCVKNNIVSEFIRFHLFENQDVLRAFNGKKIFIGSHICRDLKKSLDQDFHPKVNKEVKKAESYGLTVEFDYSGKSQLDFLNVYTETMNRNDANDFYYIDKSFLDKLQKNIEGHFLYANAVLNGKVIASRLVIFDDKYGYALLGGNMQDYYKYKTGTFLDYKVLVEIKDKGVERFIFGGGYQGEDGIFKYKQKFDSKGKVPFYVGGKIHIEKKYEFLTLLRKKKGNYNQETLFFPLYRAPID